MWVGGGGTLVYPYMHRLRQFLEVQDFKFQYFWGCRERGSEKYFLDMQLKQKWLYLGVTSVHFRSFLKIKEQNGVYLFGLLKFQIFVGVLEILYIFRG